MSKTNTLTSHHGEHHTSPANKMISKEAITYLKGCPSGLKLIKKEHTRRSRRFNKDIDYEN